MGIDLSAVKRFVDDNLFEDEVTIHRDENLTVDETWNPDTGIYSGGDPNLLIYSGKAWISVDSEEASETNQANQETLTIWYSLNIPLDEAPEVKDGDIVAITSSKRDPATIGMEFRVQSEHHGTFKVKRKIRMRRIIRTREG